MTGPYLRVLIVHRYNLSLARKAALRNKEQGMVEKVIREEYVAWGHGFRGQWSEYRLSL